ncbi:response regulator transcription factor [Rubellicoccus peritrichatus]|uniref:Response regulator transcription factor n=1 Tax=Rubellicoccus peritrichatus TaxID=3080537 RepID=A0AAQ3QSE7_9BACT|nr:response regulator transcription factor [Puniceicoccus sp. CR14]WOO40276.1 response regulator transcription factor [Puniceicoccus sp. CR14]
MKILVVEDDSDVRNSLRQTLEDENFVVDTVDNGAEGLYRASEWQYDVILLDVMLPELDGWHILNKLRDQKIQTPVLMLTALDDLDDRVRGLTTGADDYMVKPYHERELLARIQALHRRSLGLTQNVIKIGRVEINTAQRTVKLNGELISLTAYRYRILEYLATRRGEVISQSELAEAIVGEDETALSNVIDVQIHHIRRQLGKDFVRNRRGLGYVIPD